MCQDYSETNTTQIIVKYEGETNVYLQCNSATHTSNLSSIWKINGTIFDLFALPDSFITTSHGLFITLVRTDLNQTSFCCYVANEVSQGCRSAVTLIVRRNLNSKQGMVTPKAP